MSLIKTFKIAGRLQNVQLGVKIEIEILLQNVIKYDNYVNKSLYNKYTQVSIYHELVNNCQLP